jgi:hypothetical protein
MAENPIPPRAETRVAAEAAIAAEAMRRRHAGAGAPRSRGASRTDWIVVGAVMAIALVSAIVLGRMS